MKNDPRPWRCTAFDAIYCPHHRDCICALDTDRQIVKPYALDCPLHGAGSDHGHAEPRFVA